MSLDDQLRVVSGVIVLVGVEFGWFAHPYIYGLAGSSALGTFTRASPTPAA